MGRRFGSIPACAGEPPPRPRQGGHRLLYPRVCGGTTLEDGTGRWDRFTVYPRVCGGTHSSRRVTSVSGGLSPRVRGNPSPCTERNASGRSIPACAGEPVRLERWALRLRVYPRVCGGTLTGLRRRRARLGLSPRVRGNHLPALVMETEERSIPACAGEPSPDCRTDARAWVYPRVCGGTGRSVAGLLLVEGLSPRVRGNQCADRRSRPRTGSIPACAGEPRRRLLRLGSAGVYPRVCGGTALRPWRRLLPSGLSPRVRGNRLVVRISVDRIGSIPACAGEPPR